MQDLSKGSSSISQPKRTWRWAPLIPTDEEFHAALQVLHYVLATFSATNLDISGSGSINFRSAPRNKHITQTRKRTRLCICKFSLLSHPLYLSHCSPCSDSNCVFEPYPPTQFQPYGENSAYHWCTREPQFPHGSPSFQVWRKHHRIHAIPA